jgi:hypothetical protein
MTSMIDSGGALGSQSIDALLESYVSWREQSRWVQRAYEEWTGSDRRPRALAYAGYVAALNREEQAAAAYAVQVDRVTQTPQVPY